MDISEVSATSLFDGSTAIKILTDTGPDLSFTITQYDFWDMVQEADAQILAVLNNPNADKERLAQVYVFTFFMMIFRQYKPSPDVILTDIDYQALSAEVEKLKGKKHLVERDIERITLLTRGRYEAVRNNKEDGYRPGEDEIVKILDRSILKLPANDTENINKSLATVEYEAFKAVIMAETEAVRVALKKKYPTFTQETEKELDQCFKDILQKHKEGGYINLLLIEAYWRYLDFFGALARKKYYAIKRTLSRQQKVMYRVLYLQEYPRFGYQPYKPFGPYIPFVTPALTNVFGYEDTQKLFIKVVLYPQLAWGDGRGDLKRRLAERFTEVLRRKDMIAWLRNDIESLEEWRRAERKDTKDVPREQPSGGVGFDAPKYEKRITKSLNYTGEDGREYIETAGFEAPPAIPGAEEDNKKLINDLRSRFKDTKEKIFDLYLNGKTQPEIAKATGESQPTVSRAIKEFFAEAEKMRRSVGL